MILDTLAQLKGSTIHSAYQCLTDVVQTTGGGVSGRREAAEHLVGEFITQNSTKQNDERVLSLCVAIYATNISLWLLLE